MLIKGSAKCNWSERVHHHHHHHGSHHNNLHNNHTVHYHGKEVLLNSQTYFFGSPGGQSMEIAAGTYRYNFALDLPPLLPGSIIGTHGSIEYRVEAVLDIPWRFDKEFKVPFTVARIDNLNDYPELLLPVRREEWKTFGCCLFKNGSCQIIASIPYSGFVPGQAVPIRISYSNNSSKKISRTCLILNRTFNYTSNTPHVRTKTVSEKMIETFTDGVDARQNKEFECPLVIPEIMMNTNQRFCRAVQMSYDLEVECVVEGMGFNARLHLPITIGNIPIGQGNNQPLPSGSNFVGVNDKCKK